MASASESRLRVARILLDLAPKENLSDQESSDLDAVIAATGNVSKETRHRFHAYELEDSFGPDMSAELRETLRLRLVKESNNSGEPQPPSLLPTTWVVELVEYFVLFGL